MSPRGSRAVGIKELTLRGQARQDYGAIFTLRNVATGEWLSVHKTGPERERLLELAAWIDDSGEPWRVVSVSTPDSIYRDLQGTREYLSTGVSSITGQDRRRRADFDPLTNERMVFGRIKRTDLVWGESANAWRKRRKALPAISRRVLPR